MTLTRTSPPGTVPAVRHRATTTEGTHHAG